MEIVQPGDVLVLSHVTPHTLEELEQVKEHLRTFMPDVQVVLLEGFGESFIYRPEKGPKRRIPRKPSGAQQPSERIDISDQQELPFPSPVVERDIRRSISRALVKGA